VTSERGEVVSFDQQGGETVPAICGRIASRHDVRLAATT